MIFGSWQVGGLEDWRGNRVHLGEDSRSRVGGGGNYLLSQELRGFLNSRGLKVLVDVGIRGIQHNGVQVWLSEEELGLMGVLEGEYRSYTQTLTHNGIFVCDEDDELVWTWNRASRTLIAKLHYEVLASCDTEIDRKWWWSSFWKWKCPLKTRLFLWLALAN
jgi:hypothetical protein